MSSYPTYEEWKLGLSNRFYRGDPEFLSYL